MGLTSRGGSIIIEHPSRGVVSSVAGKLQLGLLFLRDKIWIIKKRPKQCKERPWTSSKA
jgi:hypothetical protein